MEIQFKFKDRKNDPNPSVGKPPNLYEMRRLDTRRNKIALWSLDGKCNDRLRGTEFDLGLLEYVEQ